MTLTGTGIPTGFVINPTVAAIVDVYRTGAMKIFRGPLDKLDANPNFAGVAKNGQGFYVDAAGITYMMANGADWLQAQTPPLTPA